MVHVGGGGVIWTWFQVPGEREALMKRITLVVWMVALLVVTPAALASEQGPVIYPRHSHPHGLSFEQWQAVWLRHAFGVAFSRQQLLDVGQAPCGVEVEPREV